MEKNLLLLSGGYTSTFNAAQLACCEPNIDCLHLRENTGRGAQEYEWAHRQASRFGLKLYTLDVTPLREILQVADDELLFEFPRFDRPTTIASLALMVSLVARFARTNDYGSIYIGMPHGNEEALEEFTLAWDWLLIDSQDRPPADQFLKILPSDDVRPDEQCIKKSIAAA